MIVHLLSKMEEEEKKISHLPDTTPRPQQLGRTGDRLRVKIFFFLNGNFLIKFWIFLFTGVSGARGDAAHI